MKVRLLITTVLAIATTSCVSKPKNEDFKAAIADCAMMCKANPEVKEYSQSAGGGFTLLFFGGEEKKCACNR